VAKKKQPPPAKTAPRNHHGGARQGAGRPTTYTLKEKMALATRVAELKKSGNYSTTEAIRLMQANGELPDQNGTNIKRYLTPKYLDPHLAKSISEYPDRRGIMSLIGMPANKRDTRKK
jgi:hypothetical protein